MKWDTSDKCFEKPKFALVDKNSCGFKKNGDIPVVELDTQIWFLIWKRKNKQWKCFTYVISYFVKKFLPNDTKQIRRISIQLSWVKDNGSDSLKLLIMRKSKTLSIQSSLRQKAWHLDDNFSESSNSLRILLHYYLNESNTNNMSTQTTKHKQHISGTRASALCQGLCKMSSGTAMLCGHPCFGRDQCSSSASSAINLF